MSNETSKTNLIRGDAFIESYLSGRVIDIGCGSDLVVPWAEPFDQVHGDAERILRYREAGSYDAVHSSHCLEHMADVPESLGQWWALVKPGGYLVLVVPDENLYEQGIWPSRFNRDHKATFRKGGSETWSPVSYDLGELLRRLPDSEIVALDLQDAGYDHSLKRRGLTGAGRIAFRLNKLRRNLFRALGLNTERVNRVANRIAYSCGAPIDQTLGAAVAQIQAVVKKVP